RRLRLSNARLVSRFPFPGRARASSLVRRSPSSLPAGLYPSLPPRTPGRSVLGRGGPKDDTRMPHVGPPGAARGTTTEAIRPLSLPPKPEGAPDSPPFGLDEGLLDRKSTRLNSSHVKISYAVYCLKKKNNV